MPPYGAALLATALVLALATARADPYVGTDDDGNLQLRSAQGQSVFANSVDLVGLIPHFLLKPRPGPKVVPRPSGDGRRMGDLWHVDDGPAPMPNLRSPRTLTHLRPPIFPTVDSRGFPGFPPPFSPAANPSFP